MPFSSATKIDPQETNAFSKTVIDYLNQETYIESLQAHPVTMEGFAEAIEVRKMRQYPRQLLVKVIRDQYKALDTSSAWQGQLDQLKSKDTFTVITAHQANLFSGPLYFILKTVSAIKQARNLQKQFPDHHFVPIFWIGSEDHDIEELNHINLFGEKLVWPASEGGAVGRYSPSSHAELIEQIQALGQGRPHLEESIELLQKAYLNRTTVTDGLRALLHELFGDFGLIVIDQDDAALKKAFVAQFRDELLQQKTHHSIQSSLTHFAKHKLKVQASPREINLFYLQPGSRKRIIKEGEHYKVIDTELTFTEEEILLDLDAHPENYSPNVLLRPIYQDFLFPNLAYIGGGGELAYWLQLKPVFEAFELPMPIVMLRDTAIFVEQNTNRKIEKVQLPIESFFQDTNAMANMLVERESTTEISLKKETEQLSIFFETLEQRASQIDPGLKQSIAAEKAKALKSLGKIEQKMKRAEKRKHDVVIQRAQRIKEDLFPAGKLQERHYSFLHYYVQYGSDFIDLLMEQLDPMQQKVTIFAQ